MADYRIGELYFEIEDLLDPSPALARALSRVYESDKHQVECLCRPESPEKLVLAKASRWVLRKYPMQGYRHDISCPHHAQDRILPGKPRHVADPIVETPTGGFRYAVGASLEIKPPLHHTNDMKPQGGQTARQCKLGLVPFLQHLWDSAGLAYRNEAYWRKARGRSPDWSHCFHRLADHIDLSEIGPGKPLSDWLYLVPPFIEAKAGERRAALDAFIGQITLQQGRVANVSSLYARRGMVLGEVKGIDRNERTGSLVVHLAHFPKPIFIDRRTEEELTASHSAGVLETKRTGKARVIALLAVKRVMGGAGREYLQATEVALMPVARAYIPVETPDELVLVEHLTTEHRSFTKLLGEGRGDLKCEPNLMLTDSHFGDALPVFIQGKYASPALSALIETYKQSDTPFWVWDAAAPLSQVKLPKNRYDVNW